MSSSSELIRILIASDVHAGYGEGKNVIDDDSFVGLEETLQHATDQNVDFVLLGGDLYHESTPTRYTESKVMNILQKYCFNDREVNFVMLSEPEEVFECNNVKGVNYEDPNVNIGLPIFSIHGNHDDFSGKGLMALDILHDARYLNLFGKFTNVEKIVVKPVLIQKGDAKVALYGIGSQRDDRLQRAFHAGKVQFCFPSDVDDWFNILVVHQNRPPRSTTRSTGSFLPLSVLPSQIDLIIWGHEHKCEIEPEFYPKSAEDPDEGFFIIQPGSTVATSICTDETFPKHVAVIECNGKKFKTIPIPLQRTRQIILEELDLAKVKPKPRLTKVKTRTKDMEDEKLIHDKLEEMLQVAEAERGIHQPALPRMRLRVIYSGEWLKIPPINSKIIGHKYDNRVANPSDLIIVKTVRAHNKVEDQPGVPLDINDAADTTTVADLLEQSLKENKIDMGLGVLSALDMKNYISECTKSTEQKKKKLDILTASIAQQIKNYDQKCFSKMELRNDCRQAEVDHIKRTVDKSIALIKKQNREAVVATQGMNVSIKSEADLSFVDDQENSNVVDASFEDDK